MGVTLTTPLFAALRGIFGVLALPPIVLLLAAMVAAALAWRGQRNGAAVAVVGIAVVLLLATPMGAGLLLASLERAAPTAIEASPEAIIILGAEASNGPDGPDVGPLTLERLRRGA